jgi:hypothetical protein
MTKTLANGIDMILNAGHLAPELMQVPCTTHHTNSASFSVSGALGSYQLFKVDHIHPCIASIFCSSASTNYSSGKYLFQGTYHVLFILFFICSTTPPHPAPSRRTITSTYQYSKNIFYNEHHANEF